MLLCELEELEVTVTEPLGVPDPVCDGDPVKVGLGVGVGLGVCVAELDTADNSLFVVDAEADGVLVILAERERELVAEGGQTTPPQLQKLHEGGAIAH